MVTNHDKPPSSRIRPRFLKQFSLNWNPQHWGSNLGMLKKEFKRRLKRASVTDGDAYVFLGQTTKPPEQPDIFYSIVLAWLLYME